MKIRFRLLVCFAAFSAAVGRGAPAPVEKVGVYDSRLVAFAFFWSEEETVRRDTAMAEARAAKASGAPDAADRAAALRTLQSRIHLQVFSTAPAEEAMAALRPKLATIQAEVGVSRCVAVWDEAALRDVPAAQRIDVTDRLVREFKLSPASATRIDVIKRAKPLPLAEAQRLDREGKL